MGADSSASRDPEDVDLLRLFDLVDGMVFSADPRTLAATLPSRRSGERLGHPWDVPIDAGVFWGFVPGEERQQIVDLLRAVAADGVARSIEHPRPQGAPRDDPRAREIREASAYTRARASEWLRAHRAELATYCAGTVYVVGSPLVRFAR